MRILAYKIVTHSRMVGFVSFKDGNKMNYNRCNLQKVGLNEVINDIIDKKNKTNWDIVLTEQERKYIEKHSIQFANFIYNHF